MSDKQQGRRSEKAGVLNFTKEMVSALVMAFIAIVYVIQAFRIPTGSMENSLLVGDFLLGLKFIYGAPVLPFTYAKFPGLTDPKPGDIIIFKYPGTDRKDYIKRCVAGPGQTVQIAEKILIVDNDTIPLPPRGQHTDNGLLPCHLGRTAQVTTRAVIADGDTVVRSAVPAERFDSLAAAHPSDTLTLHRAVAIRHGDTVEIPSDPRARIDGRRVISEKGIIDDRVTYFRPLRVPAAGDTMYPEQFDIREFLFAKHLIRQEHPRADVTTKFRMFVDGVYANNAELSTPFGGSFTVESHLEALDKVDSWTLLDDQLAMLAAAFPGQAVTFEKLILLDGREVSKYVVKKDNYFMMGDNRDNSMDSRFWGYLNDNFVKAKAFILYFSLDKETPLWLLPAKIRWNRIGKLIRS
ncbi:MAG: signal peptidase I [Chitinivibrionales bacterium]|nr:signal peptidase I [Chitinivibrionales bacterium]MBD3396802.1 signal peptidase I [Chitinivibrionales bacterium]